MRTEVKIFSIQYSQAKLGESRGDRDGWTVWTRLSSVNTGYLIFPIPLIMLTKDKGFFFSSLTCYSHHFSYKPYFYNVLILTPPSIRRAVL